MKALVFDKELRLVRDAPVPRRDGESLVQVIAAGICNTDLEITKGYAAFKGTLGHEFVGRVVESQDTSLVGRRVVGEINAGCGYCEYCLQDDPRHCAQRTVLGIKGREGAFAEFLSLPARNLIEVPDSIDDDTAVFIEPFAAACNVLEQVRLKSSSNVAIVGDGKLAQLIVLAMARSGFSTTVIGRHRKKLELATGFGANQALVDDGAIQSRWSSSFDVVVEASGSPSGMATALSVVKPRGIVVLKSTHHRTTPLEMSQIVVNELTMIGSRCGRFRRAIELLVKENMDLKPLISNRFPLADGLDAFAEASASESMKVLLVMG